MVVYKITNTINGKCYVGKTSKPLLIRFNEHKNAVKRGYRGRRPIYKAMQKYGSDEFEIQKLCECFSDKELNQKEIEFVKKFGHYNATKGGEGGYDPTFDKDLEIQRVKKILKTKSKWTPEYKKQIYSFTQHPEYKNQVSVRVSGMGNPMYGKAGFGGKRHTPESNRRRSIALMGKNNPMFGRKHSKETKEKMKLAHKTRKRLNLV